MVNKNFRYWKVLNRIVSDSSASLSYSKITPGDHDWTKTSINERLFVFLEAYIQYKFALTQTIRDRKNFAWEPYQLVSISFTKPDSFVFRLVNHGQELKFVLSGLK